MAIVIGILILFALCGSYAAKQGLTLLVGVPLGMVALILVLGLLAMARSALEEPTTAPTHLHPRYSTQAPLEAPSLP